MEGDVSLADGASILDAISSSRTPNEQYHGLGWRGSAGRVLSEPDRAAILAAANADPRIAEDLDRQVMFDRLTQVAAGASPVMEDADE